MSLFKEAMAEGGVSVEEFQTLPPAEELLVNESVVSPANDPSVSIPISPAVVTEPIEVPPPVVEVPVAEIVEVVDPSICGVVEEHIALQERADQLVALQTAMESYHTIVRGTGFNGLDKTSAKLLQVQMREATRVLGVTTKIGSMEAFDAKGPREQHDLAVVSIEDIKATGKAALQRFLEIVSKIIEFIKRSGQQLWDGVIQVERAVNQLDGQLKTIKKPGGVGEFQLNTNMFTAKRELHYDVVGPEIHGLAHFASNGYPQAVVKFLDGMTKGVLKFDADGSEELDAFFKEYSKPLEFLIDQKADTDELPGAYLMDVSENRLSIGMKRMPEAGGGEKSEPVAVLPTVKLRKLCTELKALVTQMKEIRPENEKISQSGKKLIEAVKRATAKGSAEDSAIYNEMAMKVGVLVKEASPRSGEIIDYLVKYAKAHCVSIGQQIKVIELGKTSETDKESASKNGNGYDMKAIREALSAKFRNLVKFIDEGDLLLIRTALIQTLNNAAEVNQHHGITYDDVMDASRVTAEHVKDLWVPYEEKSFAREINKDKSTWDEDSFGLQYVYLKTNFSKERFKHVADMARHLGWLE